MVKPVKSGNPRMALIRTLICLVTAIETANSANILAIFPTPSHSHQIFYRSYILELRERGHNLTIVTTDPIRDANLTNYHEIDVSFYYEHWNRKFEFASDTAKLLRLVPELFMIAFSDTMNEICELFLSHPEINRIIREGWEFDLLVVEFGVSPCFYSFAKFSRNNFIGIFSMSHMTVVHSNIGNTANAAYLPDPLLGELSEMTFGKRLRAVVFQLVGWMVYYTTMRDNTIIARKYFGEDLPHLEVFERNVSAVLLNNHFTMTFPRPMVPNLIDIGGPPLHLLHRKLKPLPQDIKQFLDNAEHGVIYFSLGSNVKSKTMPDEKRQVFIDAFKQMKQKVLWKWETDELPGKPENVKIGKWLPQTDILAHPNVKLFITQAGLQSITEAVYNKVPMLVIPFFADQELNAKKLVMEGVAVQVDYETLTLDTFQPALKEIISNPKYKQNVIKFSDLTQDQPESPMERAIWWTEYVIRHKGAKHLRSAAVDMPWYQYLLLDVLAFIAAIIFILVYVTYLIIRCISRTLFKKGKSKKD